MSSIDRVLALASRYPVFPCRRHPETIERDGKPAILKPKSPLTAHGFMDATQDPSAIKEWAARYPECLWGVPTGRLTGLVVVDYDTEKADAVAREWIQAHSPELLATRAHSTVSGGRHYLFASREAYGSGTAVYLDGAKRQGVDIRADGGYIIWWPLEDFQVIGELADLPPDLLAGRAIDMRRELKPLPPASPETWRREASKAADVLAFHNPADYSEWIGAGMSIHAASGGSSEGFELWAAWSEGQLTGEMPPNYCGIDALRYKWDSFSSERPREQVRGMGSLVATAKARGYTNGSGKVEEPPELPEGWDQVVEEISHNAPPSRSEKRRAKTKEQIDAERAAALRPASFNRLSDIIKGTYAPKIPLFAGELGSILYPGAHLIVGRPKIGKSWLLLQLALCVSQDEPFLAMQPQRRGHGALMICAEDDKGRIKGRLEALGVGLAPENCFVITGEEFQYVASVRGPYQTFPEFLDQWLSENPTVKLVIIDTETTCLQMWIGEAASDKNNRITELDYKQTRSFDSIALKHEAVIGLVNHTSKRKGEVFDLHELINRTNTALAGASGSMVLADMPGEDAMDTVSKQRVLAARGRDMKDDIRLVVQQEKDLPMFTCVGEYVAVAQSQAETDCLTAVEEFQNEDQMPGKRYSAQDIAEHLGIKRHTVKRTISRMLAKPGGRFWKHYTVDVKPGRNGGITLVSNK